jgi:hypothetical protein
LRFSPFHVPPPARRRKGGVEASGKEGGGVERRITADAPEPEQPRTSAPGAIQGSCVGTPSRKRRSRARMSQPCTPSLRCPSSPSQPHLHHRPNVSSPQPFFSSLPPWPHSCLVGAHPIVIQAASRRAALFFVSCVLAFAPQNCRSATGWSSWATHALVHDVAVPGCLPMSRPSCRETLCRGPCATAPLRAAPLDTRRLC